MSDPKDEPNKENSVAGDYIEEHLQDGISQDATEGDEPE